MKTSKEKIQEAVILENKAKDLRLEVFVENRNKQQNKESKFRKENIDVYCSDDYAGLEVGELSFYYGYEKTICPVKSHKTEDDCNEADCEKIEWCFVASKDNKEIMRIPTSKLHPKKDEEVLFLLLAGIGHYLKSKNGK